MEKAYLISGKGVKIYFNGDPYKDPDSAAVEEGKGLAKVFKKIKVARITESGFDIIFEALSEPRQRLQLLFKPFPDDVKSSSKKRAL